MDTIKPILIENIETLAKSLPLKTYKMDFDRHCIEGFCDAKEALAQYIHKVIRTKRYAFLIYNAEYGSEIQSIQQANISNSDLLASELEFALKDALLENENISDVQDFSYSTNGDNMYLSFTAISLFGNFKIQEVF